MKIALSAETTVDLPKDLLEKYDIHTIPFSVILGEETRFDGDLVPQDIFDYVEKTGILPKTSAVNVKEFDHYFAELLKTYDAIIHVSLSSEISCAYANGVEASKKFKNVTVIDSRSLSTGIALPLIYGRKLIDEGKDVEDVIDGIKARIPAVQASFSLEKVDYLYKGGRCSALAYFGANLLKIKPEIYVQNGKMISGKKYRGPMLKVVMKYVNDTLEKFNNPDLSNVFITYTTADDVVINTVRTKLEEVGFKNIMATHAGGTITSHCGQHCLGILYINDGGR